MTQAQNNTSIEKSEFQKRMLPGVDISPLPQRKTPGLFKEDRVFKVFDAKSHETKVYDATKTPGGKDKESEPHSGVIQDDIGAQGNGETYRVDEGNPPKKARRSATKRTGQVAKSEGLPMIPVTFSMDIMEMETTCLGVYQDGRILVVVYGANSTHRFKPNIGAPATISFLDKNIDVIATGACIKMPELSMELVVFFLDTGDEPAELEYQEEDEELTEEEKEEVIPFGHTLLSIEEMTETSE